MFGFCHTPVRSRWERKHKDPYLQIILKIKRYQKSAYKEEKEARSFFGQL
jgi:hypothetical protein